MRPWLSALTLICALIQAGAQTRVIYPDSLPAPRHPAVGVWRSQPGQALFEIRATARQGEFDIIILDSPDYTVAPGANAGILRATGTPGRYDAAFNIGRPAMDGQQRGGANRFDAVVTISPEGQMQIEPYRRRPRLNLWRFLPYMFRNPVEGPEHASDLGGAVRISPRAAESPVVL